MAEDGDNSQDPSTPDEPNSPGKPKGALGDLVKAESMVQTAIALPAACVVGWLVGAALDRHFKTGWIGFAGIVLGAVAGIVGIVSMASRILKRSE